jgi:hypothetical protein
MVEQLIPSSDEKWANIGSVGQVPHLSGILAGFGACMTIVWGVGNGYSAGVLRHVNFLDIMYFTGMPMGQT